jgi:cytochrome P450
MFPGLDQQLLKRILRHNDERGMSRQELIGTSGLLIIAGSETTATLLGGVTYFILKTPGAYAKVKEEVRGAFKEASEINLTSTGRLPYLHACLEEALRLYPPVPLALPRRTRPEGDVISGIFVPGNVSNNRLASVLSQISILTSNFKTSVAVAQFATYHSTKSFYEPEKFVPERWLPNPPTEYANDNREAMNPFSTGPRNCIGKKSVLIHFLSFKFGPRFQGLGEHC